VEIRKLRQSLEDMQIAKGKLEREVSDQQETWNRQIAESGLRMDSTVSNLSSEIKAAKEDAVRMVQELTQQQERKIEDVYQRHRNDAEEKKRGFEEQLASVQKGYQQEMRTLTENHQRELESLKVKLRLELENVKRISNDDLQLATQKCKEVVTEKKQLDGKCVALATEVSSGLGRIDDLNERLRQSQALSSDLELKMRGEREQSDDTLQAFKDASARQLADARLLFDGELTALKGDHEQQSVAAKMAYDQIRSELEMQIVSLEVNVKELQKLYDTRPSRSEDVEKIRGLECELCEREHNFNQLRDEMNFYKLELVNREQNYNKVFGVSGPNIGILNPVAAHQKTLSNKANGAPQPSPGNNSQVFSTRSGGFVAGGVAVNALSNANNTNSTPNSKHLAVSSGLPPLGPGVRTKKGRPMSGTDRTRPDA